MALVQSNRNPTIRTQVTETQKSLLQLEVTVFKARNLPPFKNLVGKERQLYVTVTHGARTWHTRSMRSVGQGVEWNENIDPFAVQPSSSITLSLYAKRIMQKDILIGRKEIACEPQHEIDIFLSDVGGHARNLAESPTTLTITLSLSENNQTEMSSAALNRAQEAINMIETWSSAVDVIKQVMDAVGPIAALHPYASLAWSLLSKIPETLIQQVQRDDSIRTLFETIRDAFEFTRDANCLRNINPESRQSRILEEMLQCVSEIGKFIELYAKHVQVGKRTWKNIRGQVDGEIEQYRTMLLRLRDDFLARAAVTTEVAVLDLMAMSTIEKLPYKGGWRLGDKNRCLPGTRKDFLDYIIKWINNPESKRGLVLLGQAGTGKSSIAHEVARRFENKHLGSYFAFLRKEQSKDEAYQLFTTLARDLSDRNPAFKVALGRVVKDNSSLCGTRDYRTLFESLLLEPLKSVQVRDPILVVIDALDESGDAIGGNGLHTFLAQHIFELPLYFRILVTSRPEDGVEASFSNAPSVDTLYMDDAKLAAKTEQDIRLYIQSKLPPDIFNDYGIELAKSAEGLFQWAAVACGFINSPPASFGFSKKKCLQCLLGHSRGRHGQDPLDMLYEEVLEGYFKPDEAQTLFRSVMGQLFAAIEPLSLRSLIAVRRHAPIDDPDDSDAVLEMLRRLGSLLSNVTSSDQTRPIIPLHTSFRDFLTIRKNAMFYVDLGDSHHQLAHSCLELMLDNLKFNICKLDSSYIANSDILDLESRIADYIPPALSYACVFWDIHLKHVAFEHDLFTKVRSLFETKFLFWLEVLSLKRSVGVASRGLSSMKTWLRSDQRKSQLLFETEVEKLLALANDASTFVRYFGKAIARSAPHIYVSALPFAPSCSQILKNYTGLFLQTLSLERGQLSHWPTLEMTIHAHEYPVYSVAFSPSGQRIASASGDCTIRVWDATTGEIVAGPFIGHTHRVLSVAFSPDGQRISSASRDHTIRVWDSTTGEVIAGPFTGHTADVLSVAFSPDGHQIASASADLTICVWNATTGEVVAGPFIGHTGWVRSVTFSLDGRRIASASSDLTIRLWDSATGEAVAGPFTGHSDEVNCVAFSPDGHRIASASFDHTIRVWDATTGDVVGDPFTGHTDHVYCIAYSPDGQRIASASRDFTIRIWDATNGTVVAGPFVGHTRSVYSVAFSPDKQCIASSSIDGSIRMWDAASRDIAAGQFTGHTNSVLSVALSPDGQRIASASGDHKICVWDTATGEVVAGPFTGHADSVYSVAFSPDGQRIASASRDFTIRVLNATTGEVVANPFTGHTNQVRSVAFSSDGQHIVSGSHDHTIRVWDATTGHVVVGPLTEHTDWVNSVAFSLDGQRIASASRDFTIRVWDATTGEVVVGPFTGHTGSVWSVAFSPDGQRIASASSDRTIRVWDAASGEVVAGPFTGHTDQVNSVAFSSDGQRIASASFDRTIRVWDATTGDLVAGPFIGHTDWVMSVAFSPDGQHITSASSDHTIRMWVAATGELGASLPAGHSELGLSPAFSQGLRRIPSASRDRTICVVEGRTDNSEKIYFMDNILIDSDGWMCGKEGELLLWIPQVHRPFLYRLNTVWIAGKHYTEIDFSNFVHGLNWATVYVHNSS